MDSTDSLLMRSLGQKKNPNKFAQQHQDVIFGDEATIFNSNVKPQV